MELLEDCEGSGVFVEEPLGLCVQGGDTGVSEDTLGTIIWAKQRCCHRNWRIKTTEPQIVSDPCYWEEASCSPIRTLGIVSL